MPKRKRLTPKQIKFVNYYIELGNAKQAAIEAGYSARIAHRNAQNNLNNEMVKEYLNQKLKELESDRVASATEALQGITSIARGEDYETQVVVNPKTGQHDKVNIPANAQVRLRAWNDILKRYPKGDELIAAQLRKTEAEARIAEAKAKLLENGDEQVQSRLDNFLNALDENLGSDD